IHPFKCGDNWLGRIRELNNTQKHDFLVKQDRFDSTNAVIGGGVFIANVDRADNIIIKNSRFGRSQSARAFNVKTGEEAVNASSETGNEGPVAYINTAQFFFNGIPI